MLENLDIKINNQMLSIISEIDEFKGSWKLLGKMAPEKLRALKKVAKIERSPSDFSGAVLNSTSLHF